jgi:hypothetical protein
MEIISIRIPKLNHNNISQTNVFIHIYNLLIHNNISNNISDECQKDSHISNIAKQIRIQIRNSNTEKREERE